MINTYKETHLHRTLKNLYAQNENAQIEVEKDGVIYDIFTPDEKVIEIQTQNLSKLTPKISNALKKGRFCKIVYPLVTEKTIQTQDENENIISKRKSPKKQTIYSLFKELTGLYPVLLHKNFTLEVLFVKTLEIRLKTKEKLQSENKRRRFKKDWQKIDKKLLEINEKKIFKTKEDYLNLLPQNLSPEFCSQDLKKEFKNEQKKDGSNYANLILWVLNKMELITLSRKEKNTKFYKVK